MHLDSAGRLSIKTVFTGVCLEEKVAYFYLEWYVRVPGEKAMPRILIELSDVKDNPDSEKRFLGSVNVDKKGRVAMIKILSNYGELPENRQELNFLIYSQLGNVYIERA